MCFIKIFKLPIFNTLMKNIFEKLPHSIYTVNCGFSPFFKIYSSAKSLWIFSSFVFLFLMKRGLNFNKISGGFFCQILKHFLLITVDSIQFNLFDIHWNFICKIWYFKHNTNILFKYNLRNKTFEKYPNMTPQKAVEIIILSKSLKISQRVMFNNFLNNFVFQLNI